MFLDVALKDDVLAARKRLGWSQYRLAEAAGVTPTQIKEIEDGKNLNPRLATAMKIAYALEMSVSQLAGEKPPQIVSMVIGGEDFVSVPLVADHPSTSILAKPLRVLSGARKRMDMEGRGRSQI